MATWISQIEQQFACPGALNSTQLRNYVIYKRIQKLLTKCPDILDDEDAQAGQSLTYAYAQIECGNLFEEFPLMQYEASLLRFEVLCEANENSIIAAGIYTSTGTSTSQDISIPGVVVGDIPNVTMNTQAGSEVIVKAIAAADKITITFSAAPTTASKVNYTVTRNPA